MLERLHTTRSDSDAGFAQHMRGIARGEALKSANRSRRAVHAPRDMRIECCAADVAAEVVHNEESEATLSPEQRYLQAVARTHVHMILSQARAPEAVVAVLLHEDTVTSSAESHNMSERKLRNDVANTRKALHASRVSRDLV
jgi:hypothetical protein